MGKTVRKKKKMSMKKAEESDDGAQWIRMDDGEDFLVSNDFDGDELREYRRNLRLLNS